MIAQAQKTTAETTQYYSPAEYLEMEVRSAERHEYRDGAIFLMTGAMPNHNRITLNLGSCLHFAFRGQPYEVFTVDQRLWIPQQHIYTYPDVMVIGGGATTAGRAQRYSD